MKPWNFRRNCHCEFKSIPLLNWKRRKCHSVRAIFAASLNICKNTMLTCILFWWMSFVQSNGAYGCCQFTGVSIISICLDWHHWVEIFVNSIRQYIWAILSTEGWDSMVCIQERWPPTALIPRASWKLYMQTFIIWSVLILPFVTEDSSRELLLLLIYQQFQTMAQNMHLSDAIISFVAVQTDTKKISAVSIFFETMPYRLDESTGYIDYDQVLFLFFSNCHFCFDVWPKLVLSTALLF